MRWRLREFAATEEIETYQVSTAEEPEMPDFGRCYMPGMNIITSREYEGYHILRPVHDCSTHVR